jgi:hypothetical protein
MANFWILSFLIFCFNSFDYFDKLSNDTADHFDPLNNSRGIMERPYFVLLVALNVQCLLVSRCKHFKVNWQVATSV